MKLPKTLLLAAFLCAVLTISAGAQQADASGASFEAEGFSNPGRLWDASRDTWSAAQEGGRVTVSRADGIAGLYIEFDRLPQPWTLDGRVPCGQNGFLHEYVDVSALLDGPPVSLTLDFPAGTVIADLYAFSPGDLPDWVQVWSPPLEEADLMLISSHSDDEQLFFAGLLPYYGVERGLDVQVVYLIQHFEANGQQEHRRPHEQLDGLWTVGIRNYPIISRFPDLYSESTDREKALSMALAAYHRVGEEYEDFVGYLVECIRRCKPLVVVSHDRNGEYGHGTHVLCADALGTAIEAAADPSQYPDSAAYGVWTVEKTYLHLYEENPVVLDLDVPLDRFGGKTAFQVTQDGFACHKSQHWTWFYKWIYGTAAQPITRAADIKTYSPCLYGLYDTKVGPDEAGNDLFEHVESYAARRARAEEEARAALEAEELARQAEQEAAAQAQAAEDARAEMEALEQALQAQQLRSRTTFRMALIALAAVLLCVGIGLMRKARKK